MAERDFAGSGHATCHADHVSLGDSHIVEPVWQFVPEAVGFRRRYQVRTKRNDARINLGGFNQSVAISAGQGLKRAIYEISRFELCQRAHSCASSSARAEAATSGGNLSW